MRLIYEAGGPSGCPLFFFVPLFARRKARRAMCKGNEDRNFTEGVEKKSRQRASQRSADFMRVEDMGTMPGLTPFELETKKAMAKLSKTPLDELISREEQHARAKAKRIGKRRLNRLIQQGALTERQRVVYALCYVKKLTDVEVASRLGISRITVRRLRQNIRDALLQCVKRQKQKEILIKRSYVFRLNRKQKEILTLYCRHDLSVKEIATRLGTTDNNIYHILRRIEKKLFSA